MKITVLDGFTTSQNDLSWDGLSACGDVTIYDNTNAEDVVSRLIDSDIALTNKVVVDRQIMAQLPKLRYIGVLATGYNVVDVEAAHEYGITVTNVPAYSTDSVAQMVFAHLLNVSNGVHAYACDNRMGIWSRQKNFCYINAPQREIASMSIGIIGLGNIGIKVAEIAHAFGMKVYAVTSKSVDDLPSYICKSSREHVFSIADVISLHCPCYADTAGMINADSISMMKDGVIIINTGRGPLVVERDVAIALENGKIGAYCADVMSQEPPPADNVLLANKNVYTTPHIAWATSEARQRLMNTAIDNVKAFINGCPVNVL